jgi:hypothetical protein
MNGERRGKAKTIKKRKKPKENKTKTEPKK